MSIPGTLKLLRHTELFQYTLKNGTRADGRTATEPRTPSLIIGFIGTAHGSACMTLGDTTAICGIKAEVVRAFVDASRGSLTCQVNFPALCSTRFKLNQQPDISHHIQQLITELIESPRTSSLPDVEPPLLDLADLCIPGSNWVWSLQADVICTSYDGNAVDACIGAFIGALKNVQLPEASYDAALDKVKLNLEAPRTGLTLKSYPVSSTFSVFDDTVLVDPTDLEDEALSNGAVTVVTDGTNILKISKSGGTVISPQQSETMIAYAKKRHALIVSLTSSDGERIDK